MTLTNEDLQALSGLMDQKLQPINNRLDNMDTRLDSMDTRLDNMDTRLDKMDSRLDKLELEVGSLKVGQISLKKELREVNHKVSDTYELALDAWGTSTENRNWLEALPK